MQITPHRVNTLRNCYAQRQHGVTLIEMMVAITIGLILIAGIIELFVSNKHAYRIQEGSNVLNENGRYALNQIEYSLRMADHWNGVKSWDPVNVDSRIDVDGSIGALTNNCTELPVSNSVLPPVGVGTAFAGFGLVGFDGTPANSPLGSCIPNSDYQANTDMIVVRYGEPLPGIQRNDLTSNLVLLGTPPGRQIMVHTTVGKRAVIYQAKDASSLFDFGTGSAKTELQDKPLGDPDHYLSAYQAFKFEVYFIRRCASQDLGTANQCDAADDTIPTLTRLVLDTDGKTLIQQDVIAGVEQMQVSYGVDTDGNLSANQYKNATEVTAAGQWGNVVEVRLSLVLRNLERDQAYKDIATYQLYGGAGGTGQAYTPDPSVQNFHRKVFNTTIQVRNLTRG